MSSNNDNNNSMHHSNNLYPPWEVLDLVSHYMDPQTLSTALCVSKTWYTCFSSDHLWDSFCTTTFPSLTSLASAASLPRHRLYALGHTAALRRVPKPHKPRLCLDQLLFAFTIHLPRGSVNVIKPCKGMQRDPHGLFRFDVEVMDDKEWSLEELKEGKVTWTVAEREWKAVFIMAEKSGGKLGSAIDGIFSKELPSPGCCSSTMGSGPVADMRIGLKDQDELCYWGSNNNGRRYNYGCGRVSKIEKVSVGVMSVLNWRHVSVDDVLFYLEHFLQV